MSSIKNGTVNCNHRPKLQKRYRWGNTVHKSTFPGGTYYFSEAHVKRVAGKLHEISREHEQLFIDLGSQILVEIENLHDASTAIAVCLTHIENTISAFQNHFPDSSVIACGKGCHHCCTFAVECPPQVIIDIARHLRVTFSAEEQDLLRQKLARNIVKRNTPLKRARCSFLDETSSCSIYAKRPLAYRSFTSSNAAICEQSVTDGRNIPQHPIRHRIHMAATTALLLCAKQQGQFHEPVPFIPALLEALETEHAGEVWQGHES